MSEVNLSLLFDCENSCLCEGELSRCPNVIAFGAVVLEHIIAVRDSKNTADDQTQTS